MLVQEMALKADQGFINAILAVFASEGQTGLKGVRYLLCIYDIVCSVTNCDINFLLLLVANSNLVFKEELYDKDMQLTRVQLSDLVVQTGSSEQKKYYDEIHFSPLKIHLSFSQGGSSGDITKKSQMIQSEFVNLFIKSVGVTLTEIQDAVFK